jgi:hypothetical protein
MPPACGNCIGLHEESGEPEGRDPKVITPSANAQYYEVFPNVVRSDGSEPYRLKVHLGRPVKRVYFPTPNHGNPLFKTDLSDDGKDGDEVAGDGTYTSSPLVTIVPDEALDYLTYSMETLHGLTFRGDAWCSIVEMDGSETNFAIGPSIGVIGPAKVTPVTRAGNDFQIASHLLNVRSSKPTAQNSLRGIGTTVTTDMRTTVKKVVGQVGDNYDFILLLSSTHAEYVPATSATNYVAGQHLHVRSSAQGTGMPQVNGSALYGSSGRLLGISFLDTGRRGIDMDTVVHEITHQWAAGISNASFGKLKSGSAHWHGYTNIGSLLGGLEWIPRSDGAGWMVNWNVFGGGNFRQMPAIERYFAGFCPPSEVGPLMAYDSTSTSPLDRAQNNIPILPEEIVANFSVDDLIAVHGKPLADVTEGQKHFNILFVVESVDRLLTPREMTFYNKLAEEFERLLPSSEPSPQLGSNWVPATRYFGKGVTLSTRLSGRDEDHDGLYDDWEMTYFGNTSQGGGDDPDQDGADNFTEMAYLSNPAHADARQGIRVYETAGHHCLEMTRFLPTLDYRMEINSGDPQQAWVQNNTGTWSGPHFRWKIPKTDIASGLAPKRMICRGRVTPAVP